MKLILLLLLPVVLATPPVVPVHFPVAEPIIDEVVRFEQPPHPIAVPTFEDREIVHVRIHQSRSTDSAMKLKLRGKQRSHHIPLEKAESIFHSDFVVLETSVSHDGLTRLKNMTHRHNATKLQRNLFTNRHLGSYLYVKGDSVHGMLTPNTHIRSTGERDGSHEIIKLKPTPGMINDAREVPNLYLDSPPLPPPEAVPSDRSTVTINPEICFVIDTAAYQKMGGTDVSVTEYMTVFANTVNELFKTTRSNGLYVNLAISCFILIKSQSSEPFITSNLINGDNGMADGDRVLDSFSDYLYEQSGYLYDTAMLITGRDMMTLSGNTYQRGLAGIAWKGASCVRSTYNKKNYNAGLGEDMDGTYGGVYTAAHEMAHNFGSPHDGDAESASCSWSEGYLMSYEGWGTKNKLYFSSCTANAIKTYASTSGASCMSTNSGASHTQLSTSLAGDSMTLDQQCKKKSDDNGYVADPDTSATQQCRQLKCRKTWTQGYYTYWRTLTLNQPAAEGTTCDTGKKCHLGDCV